jgi:hypothetical protein
MPSRILIKTTIPPTADDWHIGRFAMLGDELRAAGHSVTARDRDRGDAADDPDLARLEDFDQLWLLAVDVGRGLSDADAAAIRAFHASGGGLLLTRDHQDLGSSLLKLGAIGKTQCFQTQNPEPDPQRRQNDDTDTATITWPNYHSGANGDFQTVTAAGQRHPVAAGVDTLPSHPHEGTVAVPAELSDVARVILTGTSQTTGRPFSIAVAVEAADGRGRVLADSSFHHFADYNWNPQAGCPSFVTEPCGGALPANPEAAAQTRRYARNIAEWLGRETG